MSTIQARWVPIQSPVEDKAMKPLNYETKKPHSYETILRDADLPIPPSTEQLRSGVLLKKLVGASFFFLLYNFLERTSI